MYPYVEGMPRMARPQDAEENQRIYKEAQRQRLLEREIRQAQRALAVLEVLGDEEMVTNAKTKVREKQARLQAFVVQTKRKPKNQPTSSHVSVPANTSKVQEQQQEPVEQATQQFDNAHSHVFPTAIIDPIVDEHILDKATEGKNRLSNRLKKKLNFAYAEVNISSIAQKDFYAHSQINEADKFPEAKDFSIQVPAVIE
ncbi:hypothetical protein C3943_13295 [Lysinibacillus sp. B2A1]|nr:hypothetical protein C3943_13295 [Lysinibacillus sp. B2A1]